MRLPSRWLRSSRDDTAYSLNDLVDSANAGFITSGRVLRWAADRDLDADEGRIVDELAAALVAGNLERTMNRKIGTFVEACSDLFNVKNAH